MRKFGLLVAVFAAMMAIDSTCEAAKWKIKTPKTGTTFADGANIATAGSGKNKQLANVYNVVEFDGETTVQEVTTIAQKKKWAVVLPAYEPLLIPDGEFLDATIYVEGDTRRGGTQISSVAIQIEGSFVDPMMP